MVVVMPDRRRPDYCASCLRFTPAYAWNVRYTTVGISSKPEDMRKQKTYCSRQMKSTLTSRLVVFSCLPNVVL